MVKLLETTGKPPVRFAVALLLFGLILAVGCKKPDPPGPVSVKGKVVFADGKPVKAMVLTFHPADEATKLGRLPAAALGEGGTFSLECLPGHYKATLGAIPKSSGSAATEGPGGVPTPPASAGVGMDMKTVMMSRHADPSLTPLVVDVPGNGTNDLILTVK
jgi:hypothetical protein